MPNFRPAGLSDEDSESDDYFLDRPIKHFSIQKESAKKKLENSIQDAIVNEDLLQFQNIVKNDLNNVNERLESGWTPLMHACFHAQDQMVQYLLDMGADPNLHCDSVTPVMVACSNTTGSSSAVCNIVNQLIEKGSILNNGDKYGQTPLMRAISSGRGDVVDILLKHRVNIEMRDNQGWTAIFWAAHHNQPDILNTLILYGARLTEVDKSNRTVLEIAETHNFVNLVDVIKHHLGGDDTEEDINYFLNNQFVTWHDFYPGIKEGKNPTYSCEIPHLLYGMKCERLNKLFEASRMDLRTFLLMDETKMINLGINMPYERQRLKVGLRNFHTKNWKLSSVAGLYARKTNNFSVLECLTTLGTHLHQIYILEATLQYALREYDKIQNQIKYEAPDSPVVLRLKAVVKKMILNINCIRNEEHSMKKILTKISKSNSKPADLVRIKPKREVIKTCIIDFLTVCAIGLISYNFKSICNTFSRK